MIEMSSAKLRLGILWKEKTFFVFFFSKSMLLPNEQLMNNYGII